jgi:hypothetical protein
VTAANCMLYMHAVAQVHCKSDDSTACMCA